MEKILVIGLMVNKPNKDTIFETSFTMNARVEEGEIVYEEVEKKLLRLHGKCDMIIVVQNDEVLNVFDCTLTEEDLDEEDLD